MSQKASIGDIVEIKTPAGLGYVQYTHDAGTNGELVRVLPGLYIKRPSDFAAFARQKEMYFIFYTMKYALRGGQAEIVSHQSVPEWAIAHPMMRHAAAFDHFRMVNRWRIISAASRLTLEELRSTPLLTELTPEQKKLSIREIWPHAAMVRELARGWTPECAEELLLKDVAEASRNQDQVSDSEPNDMRHFLYFAKEKDAEGAAELLRSHGFSVETQKSLGEGDWLTKATSPTPKSGQQMDDLRDQMESLAAQFSGNYDGWEAPLKSFDSQSAAKGERVN